MDAVRLVYECGRCAPSGETRSYSRVVSFPVQLREYESQCPVCFMPHLPTHEFPTMTRLEAIAILEEAKKVLA
jgi:hypothetical protein